MKEPKSEASVEYCGEVTPAKIHAASLRLIQRSSLGDFQNALQWGQWCRTVATAAIEQDVDKLEWLEKELNGMA